MTDVLQIAKDHQTAQLGAYLGSYEVTEWLDGATPITLDIQRPTGEDLTLIMEAKNQYGFEGRIAMTVIRLTYFDDVRPFADTDLVDLLENVDRAVLRDIFDAIVALDSSVNQ